MDHNSHFMDHNSHDMDHNLHTPWTTIPTPWTTIHTPQTTFHTPWTTIHGEQVYNRWWAMWNTLPWPDRFMIIGSAAIKGDDEDGILIR
jgi:hypothetical protein